MNPQFGASLEDLLFEPVDDFTSKRIGKVILDELLYWDPRIVLNNINIIADEDKALYEITIDYSVKASSIPSGQISFVLQQG